MSEVLKAELLPLETKIENELVKQNVTEKLIAKLKADYMPLTIAGQHDREGYEAVVVARKDCKRWRILAKNICENGRESAIAEQKLWIAKQKDVTDKISEVEDHLEQQEKDFEAERDRIKAEKKRQQEAAFLSRSVELTKMGASFDGTSFTLEDVSYEAVLLREADEVVYATMFAKYKAIFDSRAKAEAELQQSRAEAEAKLEAERAEFERLKEEQRVQAGALLAESQRLAALKEETERTARNQLQSKRLNELLPFNSYGADVDMATLWSLDEDIYQSVLNAKKQEFAQKEEARIAAEKAKQEREEKQNKRINQLYELGLKFDFSSNTFINFDVFISSLDITTYSDEKWTETINKVTAHIEQYKAEEIRKQNEEAEQKLQASLAQARAEEVEKARIQQEQELLEKQRIEAEKEEKLAQANDKDKWSHYLSYLKAAPNLELKSPQYRKKAQIANQKIEEIVNL